MENQDSQKIKRGRGRPKKYQTEEERREAIKNTKTKYLLGKEWYCDICKTGRNYTLAGKHCHLNTKKHAKNSRILDIMIKITYITHRKQVIV